MCMSHSSSQNVFFSSLSPLRLWSFSFFHMFLNFTGKKCYLIVFFLVCTSWKKQVVLMKKTGQPSRFAVSCLWCSSSPHQPPQLTHSLTLSKSSQFPAFGGFCQNIMLPHFDPKYQQPFSFWEEGMISHQVNIQTDDRRQKEYFHFILFGFVKFRLSD